MAKKGEKRPHLIKFEWSNGVKGSQSFTSADGALLSKDQIERYAALREDGMTVKVEYIDRTKTP
jgi:hypothetical protein